ncbi:MAG: hypothetical protein LBD11_05630 [Candidatus Peribacteria bacterium]|nr:hypothetical protein [Candidatus Peribacteria bacterium]
MENIKEKVFAECLCFVDSIEIQLFILSQYKSAYCREIENVSDTITRELFLKLKYEWGSLDKIVDKAFDFEFPEFSDGFPLKENIQNSKNRIVFKGRHP